MEENFDNASFIKELDPQTHVRRNNNSIVGLGLSLIIAIGGVIYLYSRVKELEEYINNYKKKSI